MNRKRGGPNVYKNNEKINPTIELAPNRDT
jgi:hypothetical protein